MDSTKVAKLIGELLDEALKVSAISNRTYAKQTDVINKLAALGAEFIELKRLDVRDNQMNKK